MRGPETELTLLKRRARGGAEAGTMSRSNCYILSREHTFLTLPAAAIIYHNDDFIYRASIGCQGVEFTMNGMQRSVRDHLNASCPRLMQTRMTSYKGIFYAIFHAFVKNLGLSMAPRSVAFFVCQQIKVTKCWRASSWSQKALLKLELFLRLSPQTQTIFIQKVQLEYAWGVSCTFQWV